MILMVLSGLYMATTMSPTCISWANRGQSRLSGDALWFRVRLECGECLLQPLASLVDLGEITEAIPSDADEPLIDEFVGQSVVVDVPDRFRHMVSPIL